MPAGGVARALQERIRAVPAFRVVGAVARDLSSTVRGGG